MMCYVTKATPIRFIEGKCYIKQLKSSKIYLTNQWQSHMVIAQHTRLLTPSGTRDTHTEQHLQMKEIRCALAASYDVLLDYYTIQLILIMQSSSLVIFNDSHINNIVY